MDTAAYICDCDLTRIEPLWERLEDMLGDPERLYDIVLQNLIEGGDFVNAEGLVENKLDKLVDISQTLALDTLYEKNDRRFEQVILRLMDHKTARSYFTHGRMVDHCDYRSRFLFHAGCLGYAKVVRRCLDMGINSMVCFSSHYSYRESQSVALCHVQCRVGPIANVGQFLCAKQFGHIHITELLSKHAEGPQEVQTSMGNQSPSPIAHLYMIASWRAYEFKHFIDAQIQAGIFSAHDLEYCIRFAVMKGHVLVLERLMKRRAAGLTTSTDKVVAARNITAGGPNVLIFAVASRSIEMLEKVLEFVSHGAMEFEAGAAETALQMAVADLRYDQVRLLLDFERPVPAHGVLVALRRIALRRDDSRRHVRGDSEGIGAILVALLKTYGDPLNASPVYDLVQCATEGVEYSWPSTVHLSHAVEHVTRESTNLDWSHCVDALWLAQERGAQSVASIIEAKMDLSPTELVEINSDTVTLSPEDEEYFFGDQEREADRKADADSVIIRNP